MDVFSRTKLLLGDSGMSRLAASHVAVFGIGGVGSSCAEALARSGVGTLTIIDPDIVSGSNINRQTVAYRSTVGLSKVDIMAARIADINEDAKVYPFAVFYDSDTADSFDFSTFDYIVDAIDTVSSKLLLIERALAANVPIISAMGAGGKLDPTHFRVSDIYKTSVCPLARVMRQELRARGIPRLRVVWSDEPPRSPQSDSGETPPPGRRAILGSCAFVPPVAGLILAGEVVRVLAGVEDTRLS